MGTPSPPTPDPPALAVWRHDYRLSLALVVTGIVLVVASVALSLWANSSGNVSMSFGSGLAVEIFATAGGMLVLLGGTVAYYHRQGLRRFGGKP